MEEQLKALKAQRGYAKVVNQTMSALTNLQVNVDDKDPFLLGILQRKLDTYSWRSYQLERNLENDPTVQDFLSYLERRALALENTDHSETATSGKRQPACIAKSKV
ncbi:uncharacterized protein LOC119694540 [Plutella xylostella]|uniref:uncharacterized protein LOC119694540 n=1 Tax=Plutella xylostella TaxID=51655 RepID=UPI002032C584|nr:uncharacterized protein LOC119694540 [Plutella xylostella]